VLSEQPWIIACLLPSTSCSIRLERSRLGLGFGYLANKFLIKSFARKFNPVICSIDSLKAAATSRAGRIHLLLCSFPIFRQFISVQHVRVSIHNSAFLPFFYDFETSLLTIQPCMNMFPKDSTFSPATIHSNFLTLSAHYTKDIVSFYTDGSKTASDCLSGARVYFSELNFRILYRLSVQTSVFTT